MLSGTNTVRKSSGPESGMASSTMLLSSEIYDSSTSGTRLNMLDEFILSLGDSPASHSLSLVRTREQRTSEICGPQLSNQLASYDRSSRSWKTSQISLLTNTLDEYSETWPKSGMIVNGILYRRPSLVHPISEKESGYWPTPRTSDGNTPASKRIINAKNKQGEFQLREAVIGDKSAGLLNPTWVEWLMGWPIGWTDLNVLEMDGSFKLWLESFRSIIGVNDGA